MHAEIYRKYMTEMDARKARETDSHLGLRLQGKHWSCCISSQEDKSRRECQGLGKPSAWRRGGRVDEWKMIWRDGGYRERRERVGTADTAAAK